MLAHERQNQILDVAYERQTVTVTELRDLLGVSAATIRSDLNQLAEQGKLQRTHGGATLPGESARQEYTFAYRKRLRAAQKQRIGELAATLIQPTQVILLDSSTTALAVGQAIKRRPDLADLTVVTTGVWTALEMTGVPGITVILAGGILRDTTGSITGSLTHDVLDKINVHTAFLGAWGLTIEEGLTDTHLQEVELKKGIIERCHRFVAIADGSKLGRVALASFAPISRVASLITDGSAPADLLDRLRQLGVEVCIA